MDKIHIKDISVRCIIGVREDERREKQDVIINITLYADLSEAGRTDDFTRTVDYSAVKHRIYEMVESSEYFLLEALAENIARICLSFDMVERVDVEVEKPGALRFARTVSVQISRARQE